MNEIYLVVFGAAVGYVFGWLQEALRRRRERRSAATALLAELSRVDSNLEYLVQRWRGGKAVLELSTPMFDEVPRLVTYFKSVAVAQLLDFVGHVAELRRMLSFFGTVPDGPQRQRMIGEIKEFAQDVGMKGALVRLSMSDAGATELAQAPLNELFGLKPEAPDSET